MITRVPRNKWNVISDTDIRTNKVSIGGRVVTLRLKKIHYAFDLRQDFAKFKTVFFPLYHSAWAGFNNCKVGAYAYETLFG